jgi:hypothetical protein
MLLDLPDLAFRPFLEDSVLAPHVLQLVHGGLGRQALDVELRNLAHERLLQFELFDLSLLPGRLLLLPLGRAQEHMVLNGVVQETLPTLKLWHDLLLGAVDLLTGIVLDQLVGLDITKRQLVWDGAAREEGHHLRGRTNSLVLEVLQGIEHGGRVVIGLRSQSLLSRTQLDSGGGGRFAVFRKPQRDSTDLCI